MTMRACTPLRIAACVTWLRVVLSQGNLVFRACNVTGDYVALGPTSYPARIDEDALGSLTCTTTSPTLSSGSMTGNYSLLINFSPAGGSNLTASLSANCSLVSFANGVVWAKSVALCNASGDYINLNHAIPYVAHVNENAWGVLGAASTPPSWNATGYYTGLRTLTMNFPGALTATISTDCALISYANGEVWASRSSTCTMAGSFLAMGAANLATFSEDNTGLVAATSSLWNASAYFTGTGQTLIMYFSDCDCTLGVAISPSCSTLTFSNGTVYVAAAALCDMNVLYSCPSGTGSCGAGYIVQTNVSATGAVSAVCSSCGWSAIGYFTGTGQSLSLTFTPGTVLTANISGSCGLAFSNGAIWVVSSPSQSLSGSFTGSPTSSQTPSQTSTASNTATVTASETGTASATWSVTQTASTSATQSLTRSATVSLSPSPSSNPYWIVLAAGAPNDASYTGDGGPATSGKLSNPYQVAADGQGGIFIGDFGNNVIRRLWANRTLATLVSGLAGRSRHRKRCSATPDG